MDAMQKVDDVGALDSRMRGNDGFISLLFLRGLSLSEFYVERSRFKLDERARPTAY